MIDQFFATETVEELRKLRGLECMFHDAIALGCLGEILARFPRATDVEGLILAQVVQYEPLSDGWEQDLLIEVKSLVELLPEGSMAPIVNSSIGEPNNGSDEMFKLNGELNYAFRSLARESLSSDQRAFLRDFFYGVDFTHWTKWAILMHYTDHSLRIPMILRARRNGVDFAISGDTLIYKPSSKANPISKQS
jgi:hypothetical protein